MFFLKNYLRLFIVTSFLSIFSGGSGVNGSDAAAPVTAADGSEYDATSVTVSGSAVSVTGVDITTYTPLELREIRTQQDLRVAYRQVRTVCVALLAERRGLDAYLSARLAELDQVEGLFEEVSSEAGEDKRAVLERAVATLVRWHKEHIAEAARKRAEYDTSLGALTRENADLRRQLDSGVPARGRASSRDRLKQPLLDGDAAEARSRGYGSGDGDDLVDRQSSKQDCCCSVM